MGDESKQQLNGIAFPIIQMILSSISFLCCILMLVVYYRSQSFFTFSYTIQFYILLGTFLYALFDLTFSISYLAYDCQSSNIDSYENCEKIQQSVCQITSYLSIFGLMNIASWQLILIKITKEAILYRKQEQLAVHLQSVGFAFFFPIITTILPQLSNQSIYGLNENVCWLQYNLTQSTSTYINTNSTCSTNTTNDQDTFKPKILVGITLICFFLPIIFQSIIQLVDLQQIHKKIEVMKQNKQIFKGHENHIKTIRSLIIVPIFFLIAFLIPGILYFFELFNEFLQNIIYFQIFKSIQSCLGIVIFFMFTQNSFIRLTFKHTIRLREKSIYDHQIDLFQGLEEFDLKKSDLNKQF